MGSRRAMTSAAGALVVATLVSGCTTVVPSVGIADPRGNPYGAIPDMLEPGLYPIKPAAPLGRAGNAEAGAAVEARRMAEVVVLPFEVNPVLTEANSTYGDRRNLLIPGAIIGDLDVAFDHFLNPALESHRFVAGFMSDARESFTAGASLKLANAVLRFPTDQDAAAAATALAAITTAIDQQHRGGPFRPLPVTDRPGTLALISAASESEQTIVNVYTASGPYVLAQAVSDRGGSSADESLKLALETLDKQRAALDSFTPTPVDQLAELPVDPTGLAAKTLPVRGDPASVYGPHAMLNFTYSPDRRRDLFTQVGMTQAALGTATVYETRDESAATRFAGALVGTKTIGTQPYVPAAPVPGMLAARCMTPPDDFIKKVYCVVPAGRYTIEVTADSENEAHQQLAAQYLMLTTS